MYGKSSLGRKIRRSLPRRLQNQCRGARKGTAERPDCQRDFRAARHDLAAGRNRTAVYVRVFGYAQFMRRWNIKIHYSKLTGEWNVEGKSYDRGNLKAYNTYGTKRVNAYKIIEDTLNMKDVRVFDYIEDDEGKKKAVLNKRKPLSPSRSRSLSSRAFRIG